MSPIINSFSGGIEKVHICESCQHSKTTVESFISLYFKKMSLEEANFVRSKFEEKEFDEGMIYKEQPLKKKKTLMNVIMGKKKERIPVLTIRDYLCHLNYTKSDKK